VDPTSLSHLDARIKCRAALLHLQTLLDKLFCHRSEKTSPRSPRFTPVLSFHATLSKTILANQMMDKMALRAANKILREIKKN
jgi:hypothetical protein